MSESSTATAGRRGADFKDERIEPRRARRPWLLVLIVLGSASLILITALVQLSRMSSAPEEVRSAYTIGRFAASKTQTREPAPDVAGPSLDGSGTLSLEEFRGEVVVVNLWASWCAPCREEQPALERVWRAQSSRGVRFLGINVLDQENDGISFRREFDVTYPSLLDRTGTLAARLKVRVLPTTLVIDRAGDIRYRLVGVVNDELLDETIADLMASQRA